MSARMRITRRAVLIASAAGMAGAAVLAQTQTDAPLDVGPTADCPVVENGAWTAALEPPAADEEGLQLRIRGRVQMPSPGWTAQFSLGPMDRRLPPAQVVQVRFAPPSGVAAAVIAPLDLSFSAPAQAKLYRAVRIVCGDRMLAEIKPVARVE